MARTHRNLSTRWVWCTEICRGCLGRKRGSPGTSPVVARGGGAIDAVGRWGVVAAVTLSSGESEFLRKRNPKKCEEWMWRQIMRLMTPFIGRRREGRWGTMEEKRSMVSGVIQYFCFKKKRGRDSTHFRRENNHARQLLVPMGRGDRWMQRRGGVRRRPVVGVGRCLD
jgi:hypothetical protein